MCVFVIIFFLIEFCLRALFFFHTVYGLCPVAANKPDILFIQKLKYCGPHWRHRGAANLIYAPLDFCLHWRYTIE